MADYIDKWQAVANLMDAHLKDTAKAVDAIQYMDVADVRPVERGVWRKIKYRSICRDCSFRGFASWKYCPNCGRQMTTEGDNG